MLNALVVDDNDTTASTHKAVLERLGFSVTVLHEPLKAIRVLKNSPCYDLVLCDLNFPNSPDAPANTNGISVGEFIWTNDYPTVSRVSSARYKDGDQHVRRSLEVFGGSLPPASRVAKYQAVADEATAKKDQRIRDSRLRSEPGLAKIAEKQLLAVHSLDNYDHSAEFDEYIRDEYRILVAQPETCNFPIGSPFFVWMKDLDEGVYLEVYGQPQLLSFGANLEEALDVLNEVMHSMYIDLRDHELSAALRSTYNFLVQVYDAGVVSEIGDIT